MGIKPIAILFGKNGQSDLAQPINQIKPARYSTSLIPALRQPSHLRAISTTCDRCE